MIWQRIAVDGSEQVTQDGGDHGDGREGGYRGRGQHLAVDDDLVCSQRHWNQTEQARRQERDRQYLHVRRVHVGDVDLMGDGSVSEQHRLELL